MASSAGTSMSTNVEAHVFGQWAATRALNRDNCELSPHWTVTLVPSGRCINSVIGLQDETTAIAIAKKLSEDIAHIKNWRVIDHETRWQISDAARSVLAEMDQL